MGIKTFLDKIFYPKPERVLGIDLNGDQIKMVQLHLKSNQLPEITDYVVMDLPETLRNNAYIGESEALANFIGEVINKHGFSVKECTFSLGGRNAFVRGITMPPMTKEEMRQAVVWDSAQYVPYEADTYYVSHATYGDLDEEGQQPLILVATPKNIVDTLVETAERLSLHILKIDIDVLAIHKLMGGEPLDFIMLDLDRNSSMLTIFQQGAPVAQRSIPIGTIDFAKVIAEKMNEGMAAALEIVRKENFLKSEAPEDQALKAALQVEVDTLVKECRRTAEYFILNKKQASFSALLLCGLGAEMPGLTEAMNELMDTKVKSFHVLDKVNFDSRFEKKKVEINAPLLAVAIGAAMAGGEEYAAH